MLKRKIIAVVSAMVVAVGLSGAAKAQSQGGVYGEPPCGFTEVLNSKEPGPSWRIDFKSWESAKCVEARKRYLIKPNPQRTARQQEIEKQRAEAERTHREMESAHLAAAAKHSDVRDSLREADRLYRVELDRSIGTQNWTAYKTQLRMVEGLRSNYEQLSAVYSAARGEYEAQLASLDALQAGEAAG